MQTSVLYLQVAQAKPYHSSAKQMGFMRLCTWAYKSPIQFIWAIIELTEKTLHRQSPQRSHSIESLTPLQQQFDDEYI